MACPFPHPLQREEPVSAPPTTWREGRPEPRRQTAVLTGRVTAGRQDEIWDVEAAQRYDTPGTGMFAPEVVMPTVDRLATLAEGGRALEFAIGTGRVAVPLTERGCR